MKIRERLFIVALVASPLLRCQASAVEGLVYDTGTCAGIPRLTVTLRPPRSAGKGIVTTTTDSQGKFRMSGFPRGPVLLEISFGAQLIYRNEATIGPSPYLSVGLKPASASPSSVTPGFEVKAGSRGSEVALAQDRLRELGYFQGATTGLFDSSLEAAVRRFERNNGLPVDGSLRARSWVMAICQSGVRRATP